MKLSAIEAVLAFLKCFVRRSKVLGFKGSSDDFSFASTPAEYRSTGPLGLAAPRPGMSDDEVIEHADEWETDIEASFGKSRRSGEKSLGQKLKEDRIRELEIEQKGSVSFTNSTEGRLTLSFQTLTDTLGCGRTDHEPD